MNLITIKNKDLIPVDWLLISIRKIFQKHSGKSFTWNNTYLKNNPLSFIVSRDIISQGRKHILRGMMIEIMKLIGEEEYDLLEIGKLGMSSHNQHATSYLSYYSNSKILSPVYCAYGPTGNKQRHTSYTGIRWNKSLEGEYYISNIDYIVYVKREHVLSLLHMLFFNQQFIKDIPYIFEVHYSTSPNFMDDSNVADMSKKIFNEISKKGYQMVPVNNLLRSLDIVEREPGDVFNDLYEKVCNNT